MRLGGLLGEPFALHRQHAAGLGDLALGTGPRLLGLPLRGGAQARRLLLRGQPHLVGLAAGARHQVGRLGLRGRALVLGRRAQPGALVLEVAQLDGPDVLGLVGGRRTRRLGIALRLVEQGVGLLPGPGQHLVGLVLGHRQQRRRPAPEPRVRRFVGLGQPVLELGDLALQLGHLAPGVGRGLLEGGQLAHPGVDGVAVVAPLAHDGEGRRAAGLRGLGGAAPLVEDGQSLLV